MTHSNIHQAIFLRLSLFFFAAAFGCALLPAHASVEGIETALEAGGATLQPGPLPASRDHSLGQLRSDQTGVLELNFESTRVLKLDLTRDPNDIWDRIRRGFAIPDLDSERVAEYQFFYLNRPSFLRQVFERGGQYLYYIVDEIERRGLPTELALLPMIESSYNPLALSRSKASGLWQFIPSTGRHFNLTQNHLIDERRDVVASTQAALDYLEYLYEMQGDWQLAVVSYNWGEGSVQRAVRRNLELGLPTEYRDLEMPEEPRNYIPKLQAIKNIVLNPELFGFELPYIHNDQHFTMVQAPKGMDLSTAAKLAEMSLEEFVALNPGYNRPVITREDSLLLVPIDRAETFRLRLSERKATFTSPSPATRPMKTYSVVKGDTLSSIARRHGLTLAQLRDLNNLGSSTALSIGQKLLVPEKH